MQDEYDFNEMRKAVEDYFASRPPADFVPKPGLEREALLGLNLLAALDEQVTTNGGRIAVDGNTVTMPPVERYTDARTRPIVHRSALERAGLTEADVPNLVVVG